MNLSFGVKKWFFNNKIWQKYVKYDKIKTWTFFKVQLQRWTYLLSWLCTALGITTTVIGFYMMFQKCEKKLKDF